MVQLDAREPEKRPTQILSATGQTNNVNRRSSFLSPLARFPLGGNNLGGFDLTEMKGEKINA